MSLNREAAGAGPTCRPHAFGIAGRILAICTLIAIQPSLLLSQEPVSPQALEIDRCRGCKIRLDSATTLGGTAGSAVIGDAYALTKTASGDYIVASHPVTSELAAFAEDGSALRTLGGAGDGPGEFRSIRWVKSLRDQVHVFDAYSQRWTIGDLHDAFDTRVQVIDPGAGKVIATHTSDRVLNWFVGDDEVASYGIGPALEPVVSVFRLELSREPQ